MSDLAYFQGLYATALDFTMQNFYASRIRIMNRGVLDTCQHIDKLPYYDRSYGSLYYWEVCQECGKELNHKALDHD